MAIDPQPNTWQCGPFALKYGLLALGVFEHEDRLARLAGTTESGTDEEQLGRAARRVGCDLMMIRRYAPADALADLVAHLDRGHPVLLCVDQWEHWVTAVAHDAGDFVLFDSRAPGVVRIEASDRLAVSLAYRATRRSRALYDLHPLVPVRSPRARAHFTLARARHLAHSAQRQLARHWDEYARVLLAICDAPDGDQFELPIPPIAAPASSGPAANSPESEPPRGGSVLEHLRFVAETYALEMRREDEWRAVRRLATTRPSAFPTGASGRAPPAIGP